MINKKLLIVLIKKIIITIKKDNDLYDANKISNGIEEIYFIDLIINILETILNAVKEDNDNVTINNVTEELINEFYKMFLESNSQLYLSKNYGLTNAKVPHIIFNIDKLNTYSFFFWSEKLIIQKTGVSKFYKNELYILETKTESVKIVRKI